mmetsp:Transcript_13322/g.40395  ORF Transcript_13322/g.40395 Transcript_13322/m.40395 type:complete len:650 (-) Transcript_13322:311-2260(-)
MAGAQEGESALEFIELVADEEGVGPTTADGQPGPSGAEHWSTTRRFHSTASLELALHEELIDFAEAYRPTRAEHAARVDAIERLRGLLAGLPSFASATVHSFGSFSTGIYLPTSDIDLVVLDSGRLDKADQVAGLHEIEAALRSAPWRAEDIEVIGTAKVPIVRYMDVESELAVDVCMETRDGLRSSALARKAAERFPAFRYLVLVLKRWLISRGLNDTFTGGIGSFLLSLLVIASLQQPPLQEPPLPNTEHNLGRCLLHFFELYGMRLNTTAVGVRVADGGRFFNKEQRGWLDEDRPWLLSVENPIDSTHDVGANAYNFRSVRRACAFAYCAILAAGARQQRGDDVDRVVGRHGTARGFVPWHEGSSSRSKAEVQTRLCLLSSFLDIEDEMGRRFEIHAAEADEPLTRFPANEDESVQRRFTENSEDESQMESLSSTPQSEKGPLHEDDLDEDDGDKSEGEILEESLSRLSELSDSCGEDGSDTEVSVGSLSRFAPKVVSRKASMGKSPPHERQRLSATAKERTKRKNGIGPVRAIRKKASALLKVSSGGASKKRADKELSTGARSLSATASRNPTSKTKVTPRGEDVVLKKASPSQRKRKLGNLSSNSDPSRTSGRKKITPSSRKRTQNQLKGVTKRVGQRLSTQSK